jgi:hypothetical protein
MTWTFLGQDDLLTAATVNACGQRDIGWNMMMTAHHISPCRVRFWRVKPGC